MNPEFTTDNGRDRGNVKENAKLLASEGLMNHKSPKSQTSNYK